MASISGVAAELIARHTAHRLQTTRKTVKEALLIYPHTQLLLPLDGAGVGVPGAGLSRSLLIRLMRWRCPFHPNHKSECKPFETDDRAICMGMPSTCPRCRVRTNAVMYLSPSPPGYPEAIRWVFLPSNSTGWQPLPRLSWR